MNNQRDSGFTLIESLVVVVLMGLVATALSLAAIVVIRTTPNTEARINDARSLRSLTTWLSNDIISTPPLNAESTPTQPGFNKDGSAEACGGSPASSTNMLQLVWVQSATSTRYYVATYRFVPNGDESYVVRITCNGATMSALGAPGSVRMTTGLAASQTFPVVTYTMSGATIKMSTLTMTAVSGESLLVEVASRNPAEAFP